MSEGFAVAVTHRQGAFRLDAAFSAPRGVTALFGPSGSGKTTLVNVVAGLVRPDQGRVVVGGTVLLDTAGRIRLPAHRRRIGYVFQDARLFPHLDVRQNLLFGRWFAPRGAAATSVSGVIDLLGIGHLLGRHPAGLSGGERQRVAIGRALLSAPRLLLMDEPLAALDDARKAEILPFLERLRDETRIPIVYVSHNSAEVARLADTTVVLDEGRVSAAGPTAAVFARLDLPGVSDSRDAGSVLDAVIAAHDDAFGLTRLATAAGVLLVPRLPEPIGGRRRVQVAARDVMLSLGAPTALSGLNILPAVVDAVVDAAADPAGATVRLRCDGGVPLLARVTRKSVAALGLSPGVPVHAIIKGVALGSPSLGSGGADRGDARRNPWPG